VDLQERLQNALASTYRIERELGRGGMATVYLAHDLKHDRSVAVKVLRPELAAVLGGERFLHEIRLTAQLQHPHILSLLDSGEAGGFLYYVMPYVEGESLRSRLSREHQLPIEDAVRIAHEAADALDYAHRHGIIHRDIKPENILLTEEHALVADFGIARALSAEAGKGVSGEAERFTETGFSLGTPAYMSPEQAAGERSLDGRTDIYSLGVVLYEMLAGEPPHTGPTAQAIMARRLSEVAPSVVRLRPAVPDSIDAALRRALAPVPADRFARAIDLCRALTLPSAAVTVPTQPADATRVATSRVSEKAARGRAQEGEEVLRRALDHNPSSAPIAPGSPPWYNGWV
jgi:eukaryotic-like serine/threonine-protein kinase